MFVAETIAKHPTHQEYLNSMLDINNDKAANNELCMLNDAIKCLKMKMYLMSDTVKENGNHLVVLKDAF
jgi:hypothetical protein